MNKILKFICLAIATLLAVAVTIDGAWAEAKPKLDTVLSHPKRAKQVLIGNRRMRCTRTDIPT